MSREEIAAQITMKAMELKMIEATSEGDTPIERAKNQAEVIAAFYRCISDIAETAHNNRPW